MNRLIRFFLHQSLLVNIITVATIVAGLFLMFTMKREAFPNIDFDIVVINTSYPGASPVDVENLVTNRIEREIRAVEDLKRVQSYSIEGRSAITVIIDPDAPDKDTVVDDLQKAVDKVDDLPDDILDDPILIEVSSRNTPVIELSFSPLENAVANPDRTGCKKGDNNPKCKQVQEPSERDIRYFAKIMKERLEDLDGVSSVATKGYRDKEIQVEVSPDKLNFFNIALSQFRNALAGKNVNVPGGTLKTSSEDKIIRVLGEFKTPQGIGKVILQSNDVGNVVRVRDVANVKATFEEEKIKERTYGKRAINLTIIKKESADAITLVDEIFAEIDYFKKEVLGHKLGNDFGTFYSAVDLKKAVPNSNIQIKPLNDISFYVRRRLGVLRSNAIIGLTLVISCLFFFLGWRIALMTAIGIPISFAGAFVFLEYLGISINLLSMFGLIVVLGMLVDDAIVVAENVYRHIEEGLQPLRAATIGTLEVVAPVTATVTTTVAAFAPLMFMGGIMGKFVWVIPAVVIICLVMSLLESFLILPSHLHDFTRNADPDVLIKKEDAIEARIFTFLQNVYRPLLLFFLRNRYTVAISMFVVLFGAGMVGAGVGFKLFPPGGVEIFFIKAEAPNGTPLEKMSELMGDIEDEVRKYPTMVLPKSEFRFPKDDKKKFEASWNEYLGCDSEGDNCLKTPKSGVLEAYMTRVGIHEEQPNDPFTKRGSNFGQLHIFLSPEDYRSDLKAQDIIEDLRIRLDFEKPVKALAPLSDGRMVYAMNSKDFYLVKADLDYGGKGEDKTDLKSHKSNILDIAVNPTNDRIASISLDGKLIIRDNDGENPLEKVIVDIPEESNRVKVERRPLLYSFLNFSQDGSALFAGTLQGRFTVFSPDLEDSQDLQGHSGQISAAITDKGGELLFTADWSGNIQAFKRDGTSYENVWSKNRGWQYKQEDKLVSLTAYKDGTAEPLEKIYANSQAEQSDNEEAPQPSPSDVHLIENLSKVSDLVLTPDGVLVVGFANRLIKFLDAKDGSLISQFRGVSEPISKLTLRRDKLFVGTEEGNVYRFRLDDLTKPRKTKDQLPGAVRSMSFDRQGRLAVGGLFDNLRYYDKKLKPLATVRDNQPKFTKMEFKMAQGGPPVGANVNVIIRGDDLIVLKEIAERIKQSLKAETGVTDVKDNLEEGKTEIQIQIDDKEAAYVGVTDQIIGSDIRTAFDGNIATIIKGLDEDIDVRVIFPEKFRKNIQHLNKVMVANSQNKLIPLSALVDFKETKGYSQINHYDFDRNISVTANVNDALNTSAAVNNKMKELFEKTIPKEYPGYAIKFAGENEDTEESMADLRKAMLVALILIILILIILFGNFRHPRVVYAAVPFSLIGVFIAFAMHNMPLSFLAFFGIIGLSGVVVNDSIILVEFMNKMRMKGMSITDAVLVGGKTRLRAVLLTTVTTVSGVLPTAYGIGGDDPFLRPMAMALGWGLVFGSVLILLVVPAFYGIWEDRGFVFRHIYDKQFRRDINPNEVDG